MVVGLFIGVLIAVVVEFLIGILVTVVSFVVTFCIYAGFVILDDVRLELFDLGSLPFIFIFIKN